MARLDIDWQDLRESIGQLVGIQRTPASWTAQQVGDVDRVIRSALRRVYTGCIDPRNGKVYQWSFMRQRWRQDVSAPYSTGTVTIAAGVVTLAGGTWPTWAADGLLLIGEVPHEVETRDSGTQLTLVDKSVAAAGGTKHKLWQWRYQLPVDFGGLDGPLWWRRDQDDWRRQLLNVGYDRVAPRYHHWHSWESWEPVEYGIQYATSDGTATQRAYLYVYPPADKDQTLFGVYRANPPDLDGTYLYPQGGEMLAEVILQGCLAEAELRFMDAPGVHSQRYTETLVAAIDNDRRIAAPATLGCMGDALPQYGYYDEYGETVPLNYPRYIVPTGFNHSDIWY